MAHVCVVVAVAIEFDGAIVSSEDTFLGSDTPPVGLHGDSMKVNTFSRFTKCVSHCTDAIKAFATAWKLTTLHNADIAIFLGRKPFSTLAGRDEFAPKMWK
jgi:hypothetical protein